MEVLLNISLLLLLVGPLVAYGLHQWLTTRRGSPPGTYLLVVGLTFFSGSSYFTIDALRGPEPLPADFPQEALTLPVYGEARQYPNRALIAYQPGGTHVHIEFAGEYESVAGAWAYSSASVHVTGAMETTIQAEPKKKTWGNTLPLGYQSFTPFIDVTIPFSEAERYQWVRLTSKMNMVYPAGAPAFNPNFPAPAPGFVNTQRAISSRPIELFVVSQEDYDLRSQHQPGRYFKLEYLLFSDAAALAAVIIGIVRAQRANWWGPNARPRERQRRGAKR